MLTENRLTKALTLVPLTSIDARLKSPSDISKINSNLKKAKIGGPPQPYQDQPVHDNLEESVITDADVKAIMEGAPPMGGPQPPNPMAQQPQAPPQPQAQQAPTQPQGEAPIDIENGEGENENNESEALPLDDDHTVDMVLQQLEGVLSNWMKISGNFPEGEKRHNFIEIGERIREIAGVLKRDFVKTSAEHETEEPEQDMGDIPSGEDGSI